MQRSLCKGGEFRFFPHAESWLSWPWKLPALAFLFLLQLLSACGERPPEIERRAQFLMGTLVEISVRGPDRAKARDAITLAFHEIARIEKMMSHRLPDSELSRLKREAGKDFMPVSEELLEVVREGIRWGELSGGALDIAIGPVADLWDFDEEKKQVPGAERLKQAVELSRYQDIQIRGREMRLARTGMALNLGSIAKGYAVDRAIAVLKQQGIPNAIVNAGGDLRAAGTRGQGLLWKIGLQHPRKPQEILESFEIGDRAVATSGDYQRYFIRDGVRYHHIFNPESGMPARGVSSVTVLGDSAMRADALATAIFVLGPEKGLALAATAGNAECLIVTDKGAVRRSNGFPVQPELSAKGLADDFRD